MGKLFRDQQTTYECYLVGIKPLTGPERYKEIADLKKSCVEGLAPGEALVICAMAIEDLK